MVEEIQSNNVCVFSLFFSCVQRMTSLSSIRTLMILLLASTASQAAIDPSKCSNTHYSTSQSLQPT
jgi:hypothetical protein